MDDDESDSFSTNRLVGNDVGTRFLSSSIGDHLSDSVA